MCAGANVRSSAREAPATTAGRAAGFTDWLRRIDHMHLRLIRRIDIWLVADRNFPVAKISLPQALVGDFTTLLAAVRELRPTADHRTVVRAVWRLGSKAIKRNSRKHIPVVPADFG